MILFDYENNLKNKLSLLSDCYSILEYFIIFLRQLLLKKPINYFKIIFSESFSEKKSSWLNILSSDVLIQTKKIFHEIFGIILEYLKLCEVIFHLLFIFL